MVTCTSCEADLCDPLDMDSTRNGADAETHFEAQLLMTAAAFSKVVGRQAPAPVAAVITICTHRKKAAPPSAATPVSLPVGTQEAVQSAWMERLRALPANVEASKLYSGRGFGLATQAAELVRSKLYILSAGLGLVPSDRKVPVYGLTVSGGHAESVAARVTGELDISAWFSALCSGPHSDQWTDALGRGSGRVLIALTRPYAEMVGESLSALEPQVLARLRIFGASLGDALPASLHPALAPYDDRLDAIFPGTRADFAQRAMLHFARYIAHANDAQDRDSDYVAVDAALDGITAPDRLRRPRRTDEEILHLISVRLRSQPGIARILRALRDEEGIACEQSRFSRLYRIALEARGAE